MFLFGLTADQMAASRGWYRPVLHHDNEPETRVAPDLIFPAHFRNGTGPLRAAPGNTVNRRNTYMHLLDFKSYVQRLGDLHADQDAGARKAVLKAASFREILERPYNRRKRRKYLGGIAMLITVTMMPVAIALEGFETEVTR